MKIDHIAILCHDLDVERKFYEKYFGATSNKIFRDNRTKISSYFLDLHDGPMIELIHKSFFSQNVMDSLGYSHIAIDVGTNEDVDMMTEKLVSAGYPLVMEPAVTPDGFYEAMIQDPEGNLVQLTAGENLPDHPFNADNFDLLI